ncbi:MAG: hypothetical protein Q8S55_23775 [Methylococcaceae bacterium]|nr:hypothetical protein [Methylococcaceae bacterium]
MVINRSLEMRNRRATAHLNAFKVNDLQGSGGGGSPGGDTKEVQFNNAGAFAGAANVEIDSGDLVLIEQAAPVTPITGMVKLFCKKLANRFFPAFVGVSGMDVIVQPAIWRQSIGTWNPPGNGRVLPGVFGMIAPTTVGAVTTRSISVNNLLTRMKRLAYVSVATVGGLSSHYHNIAQLTVGNGAGLGGFFFSRRFAITDAAAVAGARFFCGVSSTVAAPTNVEPSELLNQVGVAQLSTDSTQLYLVYGGSAAQTAVALGTNFPIMQGVGAINGVAYNLTIFSPPNLNGVVNVRLERIGTDFVYETTITPATPGVQTPSNTTLLAYRCWRTNNATALAVGLDLGNLYIETDY